MNRGVATYKQYPEWVRGPAKVQGDFVILDASRAERYFMHEPIDLVFDLVGVYNDKLEEKSVVRFVRQYGLLFHGLSDVGRENCREPLSKWREELEQLSIVVRLHMDLVDSVQNGPTDLMRESFAAIRKQSGDGIEAVSDSECLDAVSVIFAEMVTEGMKDTRAGLSSSAWLEVQPRSPTTFMLSQLPANLVSAAYSQFAFIVADKAPVSTCPGCGRVFLPKSGKQKYCSSSCANTSRWRRWKDAHDE